MGSADKAKVAPPKKPATTNFSTPQRAHRPPRRPPASRCQSLPRRAPPRPRARPRLFGRASGRRKVAAGAVRILLLMVGFTFAFVALSAAGDTDATPRTLRLRRPGRQWGLSFPQRGHVSRHRAGTGADGAPLSMPSPSPRANPRPGAMNSGCSITRTSTSASRAKRWTPSSAAGSRAKCRGPPRLVGVLTQLVAARLEWNAPRSATAADVLNPATITSGVHGARRSIHCAPPPANRYGSAPTSLEHALTSVRQSYAMN